MTPRILSPSPKCPIVSVSILLLLALGRNRWLIFALVLESFDKAQLPVCLVKTKGDVFGPVSEAVTTIGDGYEQLQTSVAARDSQKKCMAAILSLISRRNGWSYG
jgi:hypothetical protein